MAKQLEMTHNSATSMAWSFNHPDEDLISLEEFVGLAWLGLKSRMEELEKIVEEEGVSAISDSIMDVFDTMDETLDEGGATNA